MSFMESVSRFMSDDHDRLDAILENYTKSRNNANEAKRLFSEFKVGLQRHIVWEEEILFPLFDDKTELHNEGPTEMMRTEHRRIKGVLTKMHDKISTGDTDTERLETELRSVLRPHNDKEENILYPFIDLEFSDNEKAEALRKMKDMPQEKYGNCCGQ